MKNFKTVAQTLLEETAHFGFCSPKIGLFRGVEGVPQIFFPLECSYFCELEAHAKKSKSYHTHLCQFSNGGKKRRRKEKYQN